MQKYLVAIIPFLFACTTAPEGCGSGYTEINKKCYNQDDLDVLQEFIINSSATIPMIWDSDTSGSIEPFELGIQQKWDENGRLTKLWLYDYTLSDDYTMSGEIPENIGNLTQLDTLNLAFNQLSGEIPESIGSLINLNYLYLYKNKLGGTIPDSICNIFPNYINFQIYENYFCPPYPTCVPIGKIGTQDISNCP